MSLQNSDVWCGARRISLICICLPYDWPKRTHQMAYCVLLPPKNKCFRFTFIMPQHAWVVKSESCYYVSEGREMDSSTLGGRDVIFLYNYRRILNFLKLANLTWTKIIIKEFEYFVFLKYMKLCEGRRSILLFCRISKCFGITCRH